MKHVRTTTATAITLALVATGFAGPAQAAGSGGDKITTRVHTADGERLQVVTDTQRRMGRDAFFGAAKIDG